jgi:acetyl-CoA carboxylase biotin carboxyl carrier protein
MRMPATQEERPMDLRKLKKLIDLVQESGVAELEVKEGEESVRITRIVGAGQQTVFLGQPTVSPALAPAAPAPALPAPAAAAAEGPAVDEGHMVKSPMVGTFYAAPEPGAKPYATVGQRISKGQIVCIIEAMKLMNEIEADKAGVVRQILAENGQAVEYGQPLFVIG